jgi:hypothetical protein
MMWLDLTAGGSKKRQAEAGLRPDLGRMSTGLAPSSLHTSRVHLYFDQDRALLSSSATADLEPIREHCTDLLIGLKHVFEKELTYQPSTSRVSNPVHKPYRFVQAVGLCGLAGNPVT